MNNEDPQMTSSKQVGGAFADGLTLLRVVMTPIIMFVIIWLGWPNPATAAIASMLFAIAAFTDIFDNVVGGAETSKHRQFGWFDDVADTVLCAGTLLAMIWTLMNAKSPDFVALGSDVALPSNPVPWLFIIPAVIIIAREVFIGLSKGFELSKEGWTENRLGDLKNAVVMLATCLLLASPWLFSSSYSYGCVQHCHAYVTTNSCDLVGFTYSKLR